MPKKKSTKRLNKKTVSVRESSPARFIEPMAALRADHLPEGPDWTYEIKFDGYRALIIKNGTAIDLRSRNNRSLSQAFPGVLTLAQRLEIKSGVIDGEIVALDANGKPSFQALQHRGSHPDHQISFYAFDLLQRDRTDLTGLPYSQRRAALEKVLVGSDLRISPQLPGRPAEIITAVRTMGLEGIVAKLRTSPYESGERTGDWMKVKLDRQQEFVIGGFQSGNLGVDALLVGVYDAAGLQFVGKVRAGFVPHIRRELAKTLEPIRTSTCPFINLPDTKPSRWGRGITARDMGAMRWTAPKCVAQIRFVEWTADGRLRHAIYLGLRDDKPPDSVHRE